MVGSARWWVSFCVVCGVWYGFPAYLKAHVFLSSSLSHLTLSILGLNLKRIWSRSWVYFICFWFLTNLKNSFAVSIEKGYSGFVGLWKDYLLCVLRRDLLGLWKGVLWVYEWEFVGFVKMEREFSGLPIRREKCSDLEIDVAKKMLH